MSVPTSCWRYITGNLVVVQQRDPARGVPGPARSHTVFVETPLQFVEDGHSRANDGLRQFAMDQHARNIPTLLTERRAHLVVIRAHLCPSVVKTSPASGLCALCVLIARLIIHAGQHSKSLLYSPYDTRLQPCVTGAFSVPEVRKLISVLQTRPGSR